MPLTDDFDIPYPAGSDPAFVPDDLQAMAERIEAVMNALVPVGMPRPWLTESAPEWHVFLHGQQNMSRSTYAKLFAIWGTRFGAGNGSTTFGFPDLRGRSIHGADNGANRLSSGDIGDVGGVERVALIVAELAQHAHGVNLTSQQANQGHKHGGSGITVTGGTHTHSVSGTAQNGGGHGHRAKFHSDGQIMGGGSVSFLRPWGATADIAGVGVENKGNHQHSVSGTAGSSGSGHSHAVGGETGESGQNHTHAVQGNTANQGSGDSHQNMPPHLVGEWITRFGP